MREYWRRAMLLVVTGVAVAGPAAAQVPAGGEFQVNTYTTGLQAGGAVSTDAQGNFVVSWLDARGPVRGVSGRRFDAAGQPRGAEFAVSTSLSPLYFGTRNVSTPGGGFIVSWFFDGPTSTDSWRFRRMGPDGAPQGPVVSGTYQRSRIADIAVDRAGNFVLTWTELGFTNSGRDILLQRYDAAGTSLGAPFQVNSYTTYDQNGPRVGMDAAGNFVVAWSSSTQDGGGSGVFGQRFSAAGSPVGAEFQVNTYTPGNQTYTGVAASPDGRFVVVWQNDGQDGSGLGVFGQRFSASGVPEGGEFQANTYTPGDQDFPLVAGDPAGNFVVAWTSTAQDGSSEGVYAQRFSASGARRGSEFRVNANTADRQVLSGLAADPQGNLVVSWSSYNQDGNDFGVFARRYGGLLPSALAVDTAGNHVFEPGESVDVRPSWRNVNGAAQTFGGVTASFTGPAPAVYTIVDGAGDYGTVANGATAQCADCYVVSVPTTVRPVLHWDAAFEERITPDTLGQDKLWRLHLGASFTDVPAASVFYRFVETLLHHAVTTGCGGTLYCPADATAREQMAAFVLVGKEGAGYAPPACGTPMFADVPPSSPFCRFIEELARRGVVAGCGGGNYCPTAPVTREQMPVFVLRTLDPAINPPACGTPLFNDVPASSPFCRWIEELARRGVVTGCGNGSYCPADPVTREQMAVFIAVTFGLVLYGP